MSDHESRNGSGTIGGSAGGVGALADRGISGGTEEEDVGTTPASASYAQEKSSSGDSAGGVASFLEVPAIRSNLMVPFSSASSSSLFWNIFKDEGFCAGTLSGHPTSVTP